MTGTVTARGDPYQYDDPEGVVNKENEAEGNQAESNHLVCCCGLQRETVRAGSARRGLCTGTVNGHGLCSAPGYSCSAAGPKRSGKGRPPAAGTPHPRAAGRTAGPCRCQGSRSARPTASSQPPSPGPVLPSTDPRRHRRCPGTAPQPPPGTPHANGPSGDTPRDAASGEARGPPGRARHPLTAPRGGGHPTPLTMATCAPASLPASTALPAATTNQRTFL